MDVLSVGPDGQTLAARVRFDLDLPSSSADDTPLGEGQKFPEWDFRQRVLLPDHCLVQEMRARQGEPHVPSAALRQTARQVRRRMEVLRHAPQLVRGQEHGDDIDLDAWIRLQADGNGPHARRSATPAVYTRRVPGERSLATWLLADLSQSTDAYANNELRVIDVIRDALYVFGEALHAVGDPFAMWGFSSVRRQHVRLQQLKGMDESWNEAARARVGAIRPGFYTRMGAAIRHATAGLAHSPQRRRLLMLLTDGKPNDMDQYEGRYGLEDTRQAIHEARAAGITPFCVTIDRTGNDYLPLLFGRQGYALVHRPPDLAHRLTQAWTLLARQH
jgi:nitric oxide reductase NorD protein